MPFKKQRFQVLPFVVSGLLECGCHWLQSQLRHLFFYRRYVLSVGRSHKLHRQYENHADIGCRFVASSVVSFGAPYLRPAFPLVRRVLLFFLLLFPLAETLDSSFLRLGQPIGTPPGVHWFGSWPGAFPFRFAS